jgi:serine/threonine-protein kinase
VALCRQVGGALAAAHGKGIIHRDLKPDNIFIVADPDTLEGERTKILDFGIAKLANDVPDQASVTRTGVMMGTPTYMAPEQCKGAGQVDPRADLYSLGCILFEMVCGRPPFVAEGAGEVMASHIWAVPPVPSSVAPVTPTLDQLILCALAKEPAHRFHSAEHMVAALQSLAPPGSSMRADTGDATAGRAARQGAGAPTEPGNSPAWSAQGLPAALPAAMMASPVVSALASQTTMSAAAGVSIAPIRLARRRRASIVLLAALVTLGAGVGAFALIQRGSNHQVPIATPTDPVGAPAISPPAPPPASPPPAPLPPSPPPAPKPTQATLSLASEPAGAEVYRMPQGVRIGTTPLSYPVESMSGEIVLLLKKPGYRDQTIAMRADRDSEQKVALARKPLPTGDKPAGTAAPSPNDFYTHTPGRTTGSGSIDPFTKPDQR